MKNLPGLLMLYVLLVFLISCNNADTYNVKFATIDAIDEGTFVTMNGLTIGKVSDIMLVNDDSILVEISFNTEFNLPSDSEFYIKTKNLIGPKEVMIDKGTSDVFINPDDTLIGELRKDSLLETIDDFKETLFGTDSIGIKIEEVLQ